MSKSKLYNEYLANKVDILEPTSFESIAGKDLIRFSQYFDQYIDDFETIGGRVRRGFEIFDTAAWSIIKKMKLKTAKSRNNSWYLLYE